MIHALLNVTKIAKLRAEMRVAGDRRDWDDCRRIEREIDSLEGREPEPEEEDELPAYSAPIPRNEWTLGQEPSSIDTQKEESTRE